MALNKGPFFGTAFCISIIHMNTGCCTYQSSIKLIPDSFVPGLFKKLFEKNRGEGFERSDRDKRGGCHPLDNSASLSCRWTIGRLRIGLSRCRRAACAERASHSAGMRQSEPYGWIFMAGISAPRNIRPTLGQLRGQHLGLDKRTQVYLLTLYWQVGLVGRPRLLSELLSNSPTRSQKWGGGISGTLPAELQPHFVESKAVIFCCLPWPAGFATVLLPLGFPERAFEPRKPHSTDGKE